MSSTRRPYQIEVRQPVPNSETAAEWQLLARTDRLSLADDIAHGLVATVPWRYPEVRVAYLGDPLITYWDDKTQQVAHSRVREVWPKRQDG